jgi:hypothetical protein
MRRFVLAFLLAFAVAYFSPGNILRFNHGAGEAEARGRVGGGMRGRGGGRRMGGARSRRSVKRRARPTHRGRPSTRRRAPKSRRPKRPTRPTAGVRPRRKAKPSKRPSRPAKRPSRPAKPATRPAALKPRPPGAKPTRPGRPGAGNRPGRPGAGNRPGRPGAGNRPGRPNRPGAGHRPGRPPNVRPPVNRPPGWRPPGYRPPHWRPPGWRPPYARPPYVRPPHPVWGGYNWYPHWGWYFTASVAGGTLAYVLNLPDTDPCEQATIDGEALYICDDIVYRPTVYRDERVYEIVSSQDDSAGAPEISGALRLTSPRMRGEAVREVQEALVAAGYDVGGVDAIFGPGTDAALRQFQRDNNLEVDGILGDETAAALGL